MLGIVRKWGNSAAVRLPANIIEASCLQLNQLVEIQEEGGRITITPALTLEALVSGITDDNRHGEIDFGQPVGGESW
ncbi:AbrB/MazE/SpoVT family DNA-binding domain-containing protein [Zymomonas mobilis]|uniref:Transcriptional regulator/antitoxin, MazE n=1 Tax=Zymomonas mobilis subsp. mobilis (strain ATCC 10988 / DSM 424 / LMG 404 / NCIMB 8938 / NRRL B-806 / ZM1) TaxID=555217 RepID=A0A0H3G0W5_ZYMMA|nr:AbrB/MazE/SpoVT family DNA-binding domain-containing protein [Zymomonas mobilis]AEH63651.1 transcriptional regulator/antitoxin, MazE [Zymomonas mobilis subsp. mobilis ATCC 10988]TQL24924.1 antitoxin MazE [Zymomonas mobilis]